MLPSYADVIGFFVTRKCQKPKNCWKWKSMKIVNIDGKNLYLFWTTWGISVKFSEKIWLTS